MDYELAKKLRDAGFPQVGEKWWEVDVLTGEWEVFKYNYDESANTFERGACYIPTLSELIEACVKLCLSGSFTLVDAELDGTLRWDSTAYIKDNEIIVADGSTPEEAVANLWLELNQKIDD